MFSFSHVLFWLSSVFHTDQDDPSSSDDEGMPYTRPAKFKAAHSFKGPFDFDQIKVVQDLSGEHMVRRSSVFVVLVRRKRRNVTASVSFPQGAVWTMKFSHCGRLLATAGQDNVVRIWVLKTAFDYFNNMRLKYNTEGNLISASGVFFFFFLFHARLFLARIRFFLFWLLQVESHRLPLRKVYALRSRTTRG